MKKIISVLVGTAVLSTSVGSVFASNHKNEPSRNNKQQELRSNDKYESGRNSQGKEVSTPSINTNLESTGSTDVHITSVANTQVTPVAESTESTVTPDTNTGAEIQTTSTPPAPVTDAQNTEKQYIYKNIVDQYLSLVDGKLNGKTNERKTLILEAVLNKLDMLSKKSVNGKKKELLMELRDVTSTKIEEIKTRNTGDILLELIPTPVIVPSTGTGTSVIQ